MTLDLLDRAIYSIQALNHLIKVRAFTTARSRLAALLMQYEPFCFSKTAPLAPRGQQSALTGVTPRMVATILREWEADGIVRRLGRQGLELVDRSALEAEAAPMLAFPAPDPTIPGAWTIPTLEVAR
jgi:CRP-like cAMP-binding protein